MTNHRSRRNQRSAAFSSLRSRMAVTVALASGLLFLVVFGVTNWMTHASSTQLAQTYAVQRLEDVDARITLDLRELDSYLVGFTEWSEFYQRTVSFDPAFVEAHVDPWLARKTDATAIVWLDSNGRTLYGYGAQADVTSLKSLARGATHESSGVMRLPDGGTCAIAISPVVGEPKHTAVGVLAIARRIDVTRVILDDSSSEPIEARLLAARPSEIADTGWRTVAVGTKRFSMATVRSTATQTRIISRFIGMDDRPAGWLEIVDRNPAQGRSPLPSGAVPIGLAGLALATGSLFGLLLSGLIDTPIRRFVAYMREQSMAVIEGRGADAELEVGHGLPDEFKTLGETIVELMRQLTLRQAALKEATRRALESEAMFRDVVNASSEIKLLVRDGVIEVANPAASQCLGIPLGNLLRMSFTEALGINDLRTEDDRPLTPQELLENALREPTTIRCEQESCGERWMSCSAATTHDDGDVILFTARNVTEERKLESLRSEVVSVVSHDLRSPLTVISGYLDILERDLDAETRAHAIERAHTAAEHMGSLLQDLLDVARSGNMLKPAVWLPVSLGELADEVASALRVGAQRDIVVVKRREVSVLGDARRLRQALTNLVGNAIKYTPEGTEVTVTVSAEPGYGVISVEDRGEGIPEADRERVFSRYARLERDVDRISGAGLGLYIVKMVADGHGGDVRVETGTAGGALFVLRIPLVPAEENA